MALVQLLVNTEKRGCMETVSTNNSIGGPTCISILKLKG